MKWSLAQELTSRNVNSVGSLQVAWNGHCWIA
jgi:hypothetical protein